MSSEITLSLERFVTPEAFVIALGPITLWSARALTQPRISLHDSTFLHMEDLVYGQCAGLTKSFSTLGTLEGLFFGVDVPMVPQVVLSAEGLPTNITVIWPLVGVRSLVDQQVVRFGELASTVLTDVPPFRPSPLGRRAVPRRSPRVDNVSRFDHGRRQSKKLISFGLMLFHFLLRLKLLPAVPLLRLLQAPLLLRLPLTRFLEVFLYEH